MSKFRYVCLGNKLNTTGKIEITMEVRFVVRYHGRDDWS